MNKKKIIMMSALLLVLVAVVVGITYAVYTFTGNSGLNTIDLGRISMSYTEPSNAYVLDNALPMTDEEGKGQNNYFEFTVTSHATTKESDSVGITIPYEINISDIAIDEGMLELSKSLMKVNLTKVDGMTENEVVVPTLMSQLSQSTTSDGAMVVYQTEDVHKNGSTAITSKYRLRAWITEEFDASDTDNTYQYKFRVNINSNVEALKPGKPLRTLIMNQGVVSSGDGLYVSTETNDGTPTYYYHGAIVNNYIKLSGVTKNGCFYNDIEVLNKSMRTMTESGCASATNLCYKTSIGVQYNTGLSQSECEGEGGKYIQITQPLTWKESDILWRVIRINEDGTIRIMTNVNEVNGAIYQDNIINDYQYMYYSKSNVTNGMMKNLNDWYDANLMEYDNKISVATYCEQAKVKWAATSTSGETEMLVYNDYTPDFKCKLDGNKYGLITDQKIGLITVDEAAHAGAIFNSVSSTYLSNGVYWTMSPAGYKESYPDGWVVLDGGINYNKVNRTVGGRPVINLNANVEVTGLGTIDSPWIVQK